MCLRILSFAVFCVAAAIAAPAHARTFYRCERGGVASISTAVEPGSSCEAYVTDDVSGALPSWWRPAARSAGAMYRRVQDGQVVYGTRELPGATKVASWFGAFVPRAAARAFVARPRPEVHGEIFTEAARKYSIDDAWLRAIAQVESDFRVRARSPKGAKGIMQLMPDTASRFRVRNPYSPEQSIAGGAHYLGVLLKRFDGDWRLASAAYNAGAGNVDRYGGVPPFAETRSYVQKVAALYEGYSRALAGRGGLVASRAL